MDKELTFSNKKLVEEAANGVSHFVSLPYTNDDYCIANGKLLVANSQLYLQTMSKQRVDSEFNPTNNTTVECSVSVVDLAGPTPPWNLFYGMNNQDGSGFNCYYYYNAPPANSTLSTQFGTSNPVDVMPVVINTRYHIIQSADGLFVNDVHYNTYPPQVFSYTRPIYLFDSRLWSEPKYRGACMKMYYCKIFESGVLVRHFIPVPKGLRIGYYTVPANGLWDIVGQRFHHGIGRLDEPFVYGKDPIENI